MTTSYPYEDLDNFGHENSEKIFKEWERIYGGLGLDEDEWINESDKKSYETLSNTPEKLTKVDSVGRWCFGMRHGERVDLTYGDWVKHCFDEKGNYTRKDLNMPVKLAERHDGPRAYAKDTPLTRVGTLQAYLVGEGLRMAGLTIQHVYASCALRSIQTAHAFLEGLEAEPSVKIKVEPGLFEYKKWFWGNNLGLFMTLKELHKAGYNVDLSYKPYIELDSTPETLNDFYKRAEKVMQSAVKDTELEGGNIIFVGHGPTPRHMTTALQRLNDDDDSDKTYPPYKFSKNLLRVPYCALAAMRAEPWQVVRPPCPPHMNSSVGRYDWRMNE